jgi:hypothetical protein
LNYQLTNAQVMHFYTCSPDVVIYNTQSKKTTLLVSCAAKIVYQFILGRKKGHIAEAELKQHCHQDERYPPDVFEQSLEQLLQMKIIESIE